MLENRNIADPLADPLHNWFAANRETIAGLLSPEDRKAYAASIAAGRCKDAEALVAERFRAAFPEMACFFGPDHGRNEDSLNTWRSQITGGDYPELAFCTAQKLLRDNLAILKKAGMPPPRAVLLVDIDALQRAYGDHWLAAFGVDRALFKIDRACFYGHYPPACVAFIRVANEGVLVRKSDDLLYFLLVRLRLAGFDSAERRRLENEVGARLTPERRALNEARARASLAGHNQFPEAFPQDSTIGLPESNAD